LTIAKGWLPIQDQASDLLSARIPGDVPDAFSEGDLTIYNGLPGELHTKFSQHTLDFSGGNFAFELDKD
jgi:hypothetical protein